MHEKGYAHRDLKMDNILITDTDKMVIKISDFDFTTKVHDSNGQLIHSFLICCEFLRKPVKSQIFN